MENLPEAQSLPDGFVESSAEPPRSDGPIPEKENEEPKDYKEIEESSQPQDGVLIGLSPDESRGGCQSSQQETEGCTELHTTDTKEKSITADYTECLKNQKENVEVKRKVGKRSVKSEKELLEFTLKYQKVIAERDAAVAMRERLESLCRELQRQNKMLMDECQRVSTEGQNMRLDLSTKFNDAIKDVSVKLEEQKDECLAQLKENEMLRNKLKHLADQYALTEEQFSQKDALLKSNEVFETFKQEMEKMAKLIKELKKENEFLKGKCEKSDIALVKLVEERELMKKQLEKVKNQREKLESLCRSLLQAEKKQNSVGSSSTDSITLQAKVGSSEEES